MEEVQTTPSQNHNHQEHEAVQSEQESTKRQGEALSSCDKRGMTDRKHFGIRSSVDIPSAGLKAL